MGYKSKGKKGKNSLPPKAVKKTSVKPTPAANSGSMKK